MTGSSRSSKPPLYEQVKRALRADIAAKRFRAGEPFISQREVCERFGVSTITAVRALNDLVAEGFLVRQQGKGTFVAENVAPVRRTDEDISVACIVHGLHGLRGSHVSQIIGGAESVCSELGYRLYLSNSAESTQREEVALRQAIDRGARGIVIYPLQGQAHPEAFEEVRRRDIPLVMIDRYRPDLDTDAVVADNSDLGYQLTMQLIDRGHTRIATLWGETECTSVADRLSGHVRALQESKLPVRPEFTVLRPYESLAPEQRAERLATLLNSAEAPTAFLCANGYVLAAAAHDLLALGKHIPDDVTVACMDDAGPYDLLPLADIAGKLPSWEIAAEAMRLLSRRITDEQPYSRPRERIVLPIGLRGEESGPGHLRTATRAPQT